MMAALGLHGSQVIAESNRSSSRLHVIRQLKLLQRAILIRRNFFRNWFGKALAPRPPTALRATDRLSLFAPRLLSSLGFFLDTAWLE